jgi:hypothetical protein
MEEQQLDPLELEHMMGFDGSCGGSVQYHPTDASVMISFTGCLIVISDVKDPHQQEFLRGHNEAITCMAISPSGALIASGQTSTTRVPNSEAMVIVLDYASRQPLYRLMELHDGIAFSRNRVRVLAFAAAAVAAAKGGRATGGGCGAERAEHTTDERGISAPAARRCAASDQRRCCGLRL